MAEYKGLKAILKRFCDLIEPVATVKMSAGKNAPLWHLYCFGQLVKIEDYPRLYAELGGASSPWNIGTIPSGYFRIPDMRECVAVGAGTSSSSYKNTTRVFDSTEPNPATGTNGAQAHDAYLLGTFKDDQLQNLSGTVKGAFGSNKESSGIPHFRGEGTFQVSEKIWAEGTNGGSLWDVAEKDVIFNASNVARTGTTTHGKQVGLYYIIKY